LDIWLFCTQIEMNPGRRWAPTDFVQHAHVIYALCEFLTPARSPFVRAFVGTPALGTGGDQHGQPQRISRNRASNRCWQERPRPVDHRFTLLFAVWLMFGVLGKPIRTDLHLTAAQMYWPGAAAVLAGSLLRLPLGILTERIGGRRVMIGLLLWTAIPCLLVAWAQTFHPKKRS